MMAWSHPQSPLFFLLLRLACGFAGPAFRLSSVPIARSKALILLRAAAIGTLVLILETDSRARSAADRPAARGRLLARSISKHEPGITEDSCAGGQGSHGAGPRAVPTARKPPICSFGFGRELTALSMFDQRTFPKEDQTRLNSGLEQLAGRFGESLPFGVFVFSDGRSTEPEAEPLESTVRAIASLGVPVHVVAPGDERISGDVAISDIDAPKDARPGTRGASAGDRAPAAGLPAKGPNSYPAGFGPAGADRNASPFSLSEGEQTPEPVDRD